MGTVSAPELIRLASGLARAPLGPAGAQAFGEAYDEHALQRHRLLAPLAWWFGGRDVRSFYDALADGKVAGGTGELRLGGPVAGGPGWEFLVPFRRLDLRDDGTATLFPGDGGAPVPAIARFLIRDRFVLDGASPGSIGPRSAPPLDLFGTLEETVGRCRTGSVVPFGLALLLYFPSERVRYELDLVRNYLLADPRAGRLASARRVTRTTRFSWGVDRLVGRGRLSSLGARSLELLAETHGLTAVEIAHVLGGPRELAEAALRTVAERGFATLDRRTARYHAQVDAFLPRPADARAAAAGDPALRTSVQELLDAADAKATCPLCGGPIGPGGRDKLLCDDCAAAVGIT